MKIQRVRAACLGSMKTRIMAAACLALAVGGMSMAPAFGEGNSNHEGQQQHGASNNYRHNQEGHQSDHGNRQAYQHHGDDHRRGDYYGNQDYVYAPPPVVYAPESAPGISLFIPLQFR
ncbi:hypothetical protein LMG24238_07258 [Paraburkholderia sediminicola]|uniref:PXPV repeat-containing protein n=1 Tax=Paraburkholderia sediminicola TaxID=458836 RepID=A0A6J5CV75_9BURK|nr:hypothetical protein [Paraburkholderia sediminicola]CAB3744406.1 hypothetical protein LMG24238_07258 [Paraburkholderia sediminicola]